jgi:uncharacterized phage protein (TIGR01671 family)
MRPIKFRVWLPLENEMYCPGQTDIPYKLEFDLEDMSWWFHIDWEEYPNYTETGNNFILLQYTGLKDKNGTEIYEGDILLTNDDPGEGLDSHINMIVEWDSDFLKYIVFNKDCRLDLGHYPQDELLILGNIYENPELLND